MRAGFASRAFEREDWEASGCSVRCYDTVVVISRGMVDGCDDEVTSLRYVLREDSVSGSSNEAENGLQGNPVDILFRRWSQPILGASCCRC